MHFIPTATSQLCWTWRLIKPPAQINNATNNVSLNNFINLQSIKHDGMNYAPRAFINVILFDEHFNVVDFKISMIGKMYRFKNHYDDASMQNITAPKNGYVYVFTSNESDNLVYFDNLQVTHARSPILSENHFYPFGLTIAALSSNAAGIIENKNKWNSGCEFGNKEFSDGSGLDLYETYYRLLDPQIGRFWQIDPRPNEMESPYAAMGNNPILFNDFLGDSIKISNGNDFFYYKPGNVYSGNNKFIAETVNNFNKINSTIKGNEVISDLANSNSLFNVVQSFSLFTTGFKSEPSKGGGTISYMLGENGKYDYVNYKSLFGLAHELSHAWEKDQCAPSNLTKLDGAFPKTERNAVKFENYIRASFNEKVMRHYYSIEGKSIKMFDGSKDANYFLKFSLPLRKIEYYRTNSLPVSPYSDNTIFKRPFIIRTNKQTNKPVF